MKAVLVIDMPSRCFNCPLLDAFMVFCSVEKYGHQVTKNLEERPSWCPLKPMPQKKTINTSDVFANAEAWGWNECIEEITGDTDELI